MLDVFKRLIAPTLALTALVFGPLSASAADEKSVLDRIYFGGSAGANLSPDLESPLDVGGAPVAGGAPIEWEFEDPGFQISGFIGYDFGKLVGPVGLRTELEFAFRNNDFDDLGGAAGPLDSGGEFQSFSGLANFWFDYHNSSRFTPYIGGGVGGSFLDLEFDAGDDGDPIVGDTGALAYQLGAGVNYELDNGINLGLQYRAFRFSDNDIADSVAGTDLSADFSDSVFQHTFGVSFSVPFGVFK